MSHGGAAAAAPHFGAMRQFLFCPCVPPWRLARQSDEDASTDVGIGDGLLGAFLPHARVAQAGDRVHGRGIYYPPGNGERPRNFTNPDFTVGGWSGFHVIRPITTGSKPKKNSKKPLALTFLIRAFRDCPHSRAPFSIRKSRRGTSVAP